MRRILPGTLLVLAFLSFTAQAFAQNLQITSISPITPGDVNRAYSFTFTAAGGPDSSLTWSAPGGTPPGLSLASDTGILSGTPSVAVTNYSFTVVAADTNGQQSTSKQFTFTANPALSLTSASPLPNADSGSYYTFTFQATGGQAPYSWSIGSGVPPGLFLNSGGVLSGTPSSAGSFGFTVTVSDGVGATSTKSFQLTVNPALAITSNSPLPSGETSAPYSFQFAGTGGSGVYTWSVAPETVLPSGLTLSASGLLSGTPITPQTASFGILLSDSAGGSVIKNFQLLISSGPAITSTSPLPAGTVGSGYSFTFQASGGSGSYTWSVASGSLPAGLSLNSLTGALSGTPSSAGTSNFGISVHDSSGGTATGSFALTINAGLSISSASPLPSGEISKAYTFTFTGTGGSGSYTWSLPSGSSLPAGLTLSSGGTLGGTPTAAGTTSFSVQVADGTGHTATKAFQLQIVATPSITTTSPLPTGTVNSGYGPVTFTESGGTAPFQWTSSPLPAGLNLTSGGVLSGTPTTAGTSNVSVTLTDAAGATASGNFSLTVVSALTITSSTPLPTGTVGSGYSFTFQASGGSGSYTWSLASGSLPAGLSLNAASGLLSGSPSAAGTSSFGITVHDGSGTATRSFALTINAGLSITSASPLTAGEVSRPYSFTFTGAGGSGSYTWSLPSGSSLPAGLTLSSGGTLAGTPTTAGTTSFSVQIADGTGHTATKAFQLQIVAAPSITTTSPLPTGTVNSGYGPVTFTESGGTAPFQWTSSPLPAGLNLTSGGVLSGTPTTAGGGSISVILTDAAGAAVSANFALTIYSQLTLVSSSPLPGGTVSSPYSFTFKASGGSGSYTWSLASGSFPVGLSLNASSGLLFGTPSTAGTSSFGITVHDSSGATATGSFALTVNNGLSITSASPLTAGEVSRPYSFTFTGTGGSGSYTWSLPSGSSLPAGLTLTAGGTLAGTPTVSGTNSFSIQIADGSGNTAMKAFQLQIVTAPSITTTSPLPAGTVNRGYGPVTLTESGGTAPFQWTSSALPPGLTLSSGGMLSGTPTSTGTSSISITLTDAAGATTSATFSLSVYSQLTISSVSPLPAGAVSSPYTFTFSAGGGSGSYTWSVISGSVPNGLSLGASTGLLSGTPSTAGTSNFIVGVRDSSGGTFAAPFSLTINSGLSITSTSPLATGEVSRPYSFTFAATGGSGSYNWSLASGSNLPAGLSLSSGGLLSGTPTASGTTSFSVQITDSVGDTVTKIFQVQMLAAPSITTTSPLPTGTLNRGYSPLTFTEAGGTAPFQWTSSPLPAGLNLSSGGLLSGTPTSAGTSSISVTLTDAAGATASATFSLSIYSQLTIGSASPLPAGAVNSPYSFTFQAGGGSGSYTWSVASGSLPSGFSLNPSTGLLVGTPSASGTSNFVINVHDTSGGTATGSFALTINNSLSITSASILTQGEVSRPYSFTFTGTGGSGSYTWSLPSGSSLPAGMTLSPGGILGGTPTAPGTTSFSIQIADGTGNTATKIFQVQIVAAPSITTASPLPAGTLNRGYTPLTFTEAGGTAPFQWTSSPLPAGLNLSSGGLLSGTPTSTGTSSISITLTDAAGATASATFSLSVYSQLTISSTSPLPAGAVNSAYNFTFQAGGGSGSYTWSISSGSLPSGLALGPSTGIVSGTPSTAGTANFVLAVHDSSGGTATGSFALTINNGLSITSTSPLSQGEVSRPYSFTFTGTGGSGSYAWSLSSGSSLPAGLSLSPGGTLGGTPTTPGTTSFSVQIADGSGSTATKAFQLQIVTAPSITTAPPLPPGTLNTAYSPITFTGSGGTPPFQWTSSTLPAGLSLTTAGLLSGTPTSAGTSNISITLTDAAGATASASYSLTVYSQLTVASASPLPAGAVSSAYTFTFQAGGGSGSYTWSVASGSLPSGFSLNPSTGLLSGTPTATGTSSFVIQVADPQRESTATKAFSLTINNGLSITSSSPLTTGEASRPYSFTFTGTGGSGSYTWSLPSGSNLPAGLTLSPGGLLSGTPTAAATASFSVQVADASGNTISKNFQLQIIAAPSITTASPLPPGTPNHSYSQLTFTESGGTAPFQWSSSQLPAGLSLTSGGVLSGIPTGSGTTLFSITLTDAMGGTASATFSLSVVSQLTITSGSPLAAGTVGTAYSFTFQAGGGSGSYTWSIASGSLPAGLSLSSGGLLSGTPSGGGNFTFVVQVTDVQNNDQTSKTFSLAVTGTFTITNLATLPNGTAGASYTQQLTTSGGFGSVTWSAVSALPAGLTLAPSGLISGIPSAPGTFTFNVQASDGATPADTSTKAFTVVIAAAIPPLVITSPATLSGQLGTTYSFMFTATGGTPPYIWSVNGALPAGLALASASGVVSGKASGVGPYSFTIQVTESTGTSASQPTQLQFTLPPAPPLQITGIPSNPAANSQPTFQVTIPSAFSFDIQGTLNLTFNSPSGIDDPAIQFTNGTRNLGFTIPAGSTTAVYTAGESPVFLTGTIAGTITLTTTQYQALGVALNPVPPPVQVLIPPTAPVITSVTATRGSGGFTVTVIGYSPTRDVTAGTFSFLGSNLDTPQLPLDLSALFQSWFSNTTSDQFGSQFKLTQPFNLNGGSGNVKTVSVTLTNSIGTSQLVQVPVE